MNLSKLVSKYIRQRHLNEDLRNSASRMMTRSHRLTNNYVIPVGGRNLLYIYSNKYGNQFVVNQIYLDSFECDEDALYVILKTHRYINDAVYQLWVKHRNISQSNPFQRVRDLITSMNIFIVVALIISFLYLNNIGYSIDYTSYTFSRAFLISLLAVYGIIMGGGVVYCCLCHYELHNYDKEVVKLVLGILKQLEDKIFQQNKLIVRCDKNLSWYSFEKIRKNCDNNEP